MVFDDKVVKFFDFCGRDWVLFKCGFIYFRGLDDFELGVYGWFVDILLFLFDFMFFLGYRKWLLLKEVGVGLWDVFECIDLWLILLNVLL